MNYRAVRAIYLFEMARTWRTVLVASAGAAGLARAKLSSARLASAPATPPISAYALKSKRPVESRFS